MVDKTSKTNPLNSLGADDDVQVLRGVRRKHPDERDSGVERIGGERASSELFINLTLTFHSDSAQSEELDLIVVGALLTSVMFVAEAVSYMTYMKDISEESR